MEALALILFIAAVLIVGIVIARRKRSPSGAQRPGKPTGPIRDRLED